MLWLLRLGGAVQRALPRASKGMHACERSFASHHVSTHLATPSHISQSTLVPPLAQDLFARDWIDRLGLHDLVTPPPRKEPSSVQPSALPHGAPSASDRSSTQGQNFFHLSVRHCSSITRDLLPPLRKWAPPRFPPTLRS